MPSLRGKLPPSGKVTISDRDKAIDNIIAFYTAPNDIELSDNHEEIRLRLLHIESQLLDGKSRKEAVRTHAVKYYISEKTAYQDYADCVRLTPFVHSAPKSLYRAMVTEWARKSYELAAQEGDTSTMLAAAAMIIKAHALDKEDAVIPQMDTPIILISGYDELKTLLTKAYEIKDGRINIDDFNLIDVNHITDAEHEIID
jgi:hypothetical protein